MEYHADSFWPLVAYCSAVLFAVGGILGLSHILGPRHRGRYTNLPYESGMPLTGSARLRLSIKFYLVAMFFVLFDLESAFIFAWAVSARRLGRAGYIEILVFIGVLAAALAYLWRLGALDWGASMERQSKPDEGVFSHGRVA